MSDLNDATMRFQLQKAAAYRELCRAISRSGRENIFWAVIFSVVFYFPQPNRPLFWLIVGILVVGGELFVGFFKWFWPCAEGYLLDGLVILVFFFWNSGLAILQFKLLGRPDPITGFLAIYMLVMAMNRFKAYRQLLTLFANRPTAAHIAWFDELVHEIRTADPQTDDQALDLPTKPHWKAKLLGATAFFVPQRGTSVVITGPDEFQLFRHPEDQGTGSRKAVLMIHHNTFPEFEIDDASWGNYEKWQSSQESE